MKKDELLAPGHTTCAGCGPAIATRMMLRASGPNVIVCEATGCMEVTTTKYPETSWKVPWIHVLFENAPAVAAGVREALNAKGDTTTKVIAFGGDGGMIDIGFGALSGLLERGHEVLTIIYDNEAYMNCLSLSTLVMTKEGLKKITEIKEGDAIYAFDLDSHNLVLKKCTGVFDNGKKEIFELDTTHHSIKATENHPFLIVQRNGRGNENRLMWKTISELRSGDEIIVLKHTDAAHETSYGFKFKNLNKYPSQSKYWDFLAGNEFFETESVRSIKKCGIEPTLDLRVEGEHNFIANGIVVHNTGIQRSGGTPWHASTTTTPVGKFSKGKPQWKKDIVSIALGHHIPYAATASIAFPFDFEKKIKKALSIKGPTLIHVHTPCPVGWYYETEKTIQLARLAVDSKMWLLYEVENGKRTLTQQPKGVPVTDYLKAQKRFRHLTDEDVAEYQKRVDEIFREMFGV